MNQVLHFFRRFSTQDNIQKDILETEYDSDTNTFRILNRDLNMVKLLVDLGIGQLSQRPNRNPPPLVDKIPYCMAQNNGGVI